MCYKANKPTSKTLKMKETTTVRLNTIVGKSFNYKNEDLFFENFKELSSGKICIITHLKTFNFLESEIPMFLDELKEIKNPEFRENAIVSQNTKALAGYTPSAENADMKATLMHLLAKVKVDPAAIPQAKAACEIVNSIVNVQKTELDMIKMITKSQDK